MLMLSGCATDPVAPAQAWPRPPVPPYLLHLPGISGDRGLDSRMVTALTQAGFEGTTEVYDWTIGNAGLMALTNQQRHRRESEAVAAKITAVRREDPNREIILTAHSGGTGVIVWALEKLPPDVRVDRVLLMASALSPDYDLSRALAHVDQAMLNFYSPLDVAVLDIGTSLFGTIDGKKTAAAGCVGFNIPPTADPQQYEKLRQFAYTAEWMQWGNTGSHIGSMTRPFARAVLAPIVMGLTLNPPIVRGANELLTTQPAE
jgi:pimeloyl-ACP methyl ester carboxylesterase